MEEHDHIGEVALPEGAEFPDDRYTVPDVPLPARLAEEQLVAVLATIYYCSSARAEVTVRRGLSGFESMQHAVCVAKSIIAEAKR